MDEIVKELVKIADDLDRDGKPELAAAVDETIMSLAARPKAPLKKMDEKVKKDLMGFLGKVTNNLEESVKSLEELFRRMRYFGIDNEMKGLDLDESFKDIKKLHNCMDGASKKFYEISFGRKPPKGHLKDMLGDKKEEQSAEDPFSFARIPAEQRGGEPARQTPEEDKSFVGMPSPEEMDDFWGDKQPSEEGFEDSADDGEDEDA